MRQFVPVPRERDRAPRVRRRDSITLWSSEIMAKDDTQAS
jgi:hypothetical protein